MRSVSAQPDSGADAAYASGIAASPKSQKVINYVSSGNSESSLFSFVEIILRGQIAVMHQNEMAGVFLRECGEFFV